MALHIVNSPFRSCVYLHSFKLIKVCRKEWKKSYTFIDQFCFNFEKHLITSHIIRDIDSDIMSEHSFPMPPFKRFMRRTGVPRGLLRFYVLKLLKEKPMSGSEIIEEIKRETNDKWVPSPGSIYPLLAWMQDKGYTKRLAVEEGGIKRYMLTDQGKDFFKTQVKFGEAFRKRLEFLAPMLLSGFRFGNNSEKFKEIQKPVKRFITSILKLRMQLEENPSDQTINEVVDFLNESIQKIEALSEKIKKER
jgi:DNA-binding PadR family transcriptional regulator